MAKDPAKPKKTVQITEPPRTLQKPSYRSFRLQKRIQGGQVASAFSLFGQTLRLLRQNWKLFLGIVLVFGILNAVLVRGFSAGANLDDAKAVLDELFTGNWGQLVGGLTIFVYLLGSSGNTASPTAGAYQFILTLVISLALIWTLRQLHAGHKVGVRDGFYQGMTPFVQFTLVLLVIGLQLLPMAIGLFLYSTVVGAGIAVSGLEQVVWALLAFCLSLLSLYMATSSLFALYIVALPGMTPLRALRSARQLVAHRRWTIMRKVIFLPLVLVLLAAVLVIPLIMFATPFAAWAFFLLSMCVIPIIHSYMYGLYRSLL